MYTDIHYLMSCFNCIILVNHADIIDSSLHHVCVYIYMQITYDTAVYQQLNKYIYIYNRGDCDSKNPQSSHYKY